MRRRYHVTATVGTRALYTSYFYFQDDYIVLHTLNRRDFFLIIFILSPYIIIVVRCIGTRRVSRPTARATCK